MSNGWLLRDLNFFIRDYVRYEWGRVYIDDYKQHRKAPEVEFQLDPRMPRVYILGDEKLLTLRNGFGNLMENINYHGKSDRRRVKTLLGGGLQVVEFAWDGKILAPEEISRVNQMYEEGRSMQEKPDKNGTKIAGFCLGQFGGSVRIERFNDGIYVARNVIQLPIPEGEQA